MSGDAPGPGSDPPSTPTASIEELDALRKELDVAKKAAASAEKKLAVMRAMSEADSKKNGDVAVELDSLRERCAEAEADLDKVQKELDATAEELDASRRLCEAKTVAAERLDEALREATKKANAKQKRAAEAEATRAGDAERRAASAEGELASLRVELSKVRAAAASRKEELEASRRELAELADASADELQIADDARTRAETERDEALERMRTAESVKAQAEVRTAEAEERADAAEAEAERLLEESEERGRRFTMVQSQYVKKEEELSAEVERLRRESATQPATESGRGVAADEETAGLRESLAGLRESLARAERAAVEAEARAEKAEAEAKNREAPGTAEADEAGNETHVARVGELERVVESLRRELGDAREEMARAERASAAAGDSDKNAEGSRTAPGSNDESVLFKRVESAEALAKRLRATVESLERDNKSLQWQISMSAGSPPPGKSPSATPLRGTSAAGYLAGDGLLAQLAGGRRRNLKRNLIFSYLALIHVVLFVEISRGCPSA